MLPTNYSTINFSARYRTDVEELDDHIKGVYVSLEGSAPTMASTAGGSTAGPIGSTAGSVAPGSTLQTAGVSSVFGGIGLGVSVPEAESGLDIVKRLIGDRTAAWSAHNHFGGGILLALLGSFIGGFGDFLDAKEESSDKQAPS